MRAAAPQLHGRPCEMRGTGTSGGGREACVGRTATPIQRNSSTQERTAMNAPSTRPPPRRPPSPVASGCIPSIRPLPAVTQPRPPSSRRRNGGRDRRPPSPAGGLAFRQITERAEPLAPARGSGGRCPPLHVDRRLGRGEREGNPPLLRIDGQDRHHQLVADFDGFSGVPQM